jgi:hypothetical protein
LFANYIIRARQNQVIYLGQSLPFDELVFAYNIHKPDYLLTAITTVPANHAVQPFVNRMAKSFSESHLLLTGYQVVGQDIDLPDNATVINQMEDLIRIAES